MCTVEIGMSSSTETFKNVCRLCSTSKELLWLFNEKMADNMADIVYITSGVQIQRTDTVSQMVCSTCCQVTIKMYQFRLKSMKNDEDLKARCAGYKVAQMLSSPSVRSIVSPEPPGPATPPPPGPATPPPSEPDVHSSVKDIMDKYPKIRLPERCMSAHMGAYITLLRTEVDDYLVKHNLTYDDIMEAKSVETKEVGKKSVETQEVEKKTRSVKRMSFLSEDEFEEDKEDEDDVWMPKNVRKKTKFGIEVKQKRRRSEKSENNRLSVSSDSNSSSGNILRLHLINKSNKTDSDTKPEAVNTSQSHEEKEAVIDLEERSSPAFSTFGPSFMTFFSSRPLFDPDDDDVILVPNETQSTPPDPKDDVSVPNEPTPPDPEPTNQPDFSLVSVVEKTHTLYTCRVCDSQHSSLKEMKIHERRSHTKCPFCTKRFRTLANREYHMIHACTKTPLKMKDARLALVRVDEDPETRKRFPSAFGDVVDEEKEKPTNSISLPEQNDVAAAPQEQDVAAAPQQEQDVAAAHQEHDVAAGPQEQDAASTPQDDDVICISDEESDGRPHGERRYNIINNVNIYDDDHKVLVNILSGALRDKTGHLKRISELCPITDGESGRIKVFKNLRKYLNYHKVPVEIQHGASLSVDYKSYTPQPTPRLAALWKHLTPKELVRTQPTVATPVMPPVNAQPAPSIPMVLNGTPAVKFNNTRYQNYVLVGGMFSSTQLLPTASSVPIATFTSTPVVSVPPTVTKPVASVTNTLVSSKCPPQVQPDKVPESVREGGNVTQPIIRVKNLKELS